LAIFCFPEKKNVSFVIICEKIQINSENKLVKIFPFDVGNGVLISPQGKHWCRLAGVAMIAPVINYQWPSLPENLIKRDYRRKLIKWASLLAKYFPRLLLWWVTQKWLPSNSVIEKNPAFFNKRDIDILETIPGFPMLSKASFTCFFHLFYYVNIHRFC